MPVTTADRKRVEEKAHASVGEQLIGDQLVRRDVVSLRLDTAAQERMRRGKRVHAFEPREHLVGDAMHHLSVLALDLGMQAAEVGEARRRARAAEKAVELHEHRRARAAAVAAAMPAGPPPSTTTSCSASTSVLRSGSCTNIQSDYASEAATRSAAGRSHAPRRCHLPALAAEA